MARAPVFDQTYRHYLERLASLDIQACGDILGFDLDGPEAVVPLLGQSYHVGSKGVSDETGRKPPLGICIILFKYLIMCPAGPPVDESLCTYKDFRDAAPLVHYFNQNVTGKVAERFTGRAQALQAACERSGGEPFVADLGYEVKYCFAGLPKVPVYLLFNDEGDGFPAQCTLLFQRSAAIYLDMESLSMLGVALVEKLLRRMDIERTTE